MRIALFQFRPAGSLKVNLSRSLHAIEQAAAQGAQLVCFPELQLSPFFPQHPNQDVSDYLVGTDHPAVERMRTSCARHRIAAVLNLYMELEGQRYDASPIIDADGSLLGVSKMVHIVQAPIFREQDYYTPSDCGFETYTTQAGRVGVVICFDRHYPESIRTCVLKGAQLVVIPTANINGEPLELFEWELRVSAMQNGVFIAMCNRVGVEDDMQFCGESMVVDPHGEVVVKADSTEQLVLADVHLGEIVAARKARPYLKLYRQDVYFK
jgi:predicted amidohydrolase